MSNKIIAVCSDSPYSAQSDDGLNWIRVDADNYRWKTISSGYDSGTFSYSMIDIYNPYALVTYSTTDDGVTWTSGVLPTPSLSCIVAVADESQGGVFTSYDGITFALVSPVYDVEYNRQYGGNKIYQTLSAVVTSHCEAYAINNLTLFLQHAHAVSTNEATAHTMKCKVQICRASVFSKGFFSSTVDRHGKYPETKEITCEALSTSMAGHSVPTSVSGYSTSRRVGIINPMTCEAVSTSAGFFTGIKTKIFTIMCGAVSTSSSTNNDSPTRHDRWPQTHAYTFKAVSTSIASSIREFLW